MVRILGFAIDFRKMYRKVRLEVQQKVEARLVECGSQLALDGLMLLKIMTTFWPIFQAVPGSLYRLVAHSRQADPWSGRIRAHAAVDST
jgi:hypothetical protein